MNESKSETTIDELADSFAVRLERGEHPSIEEYKEKYPHLAERIDAVFPALVMLGRVESVPQVRKLAVDDSIPEMLGEYQIIQEVGRGGMGIVFEAQHTTMRRRVALKVLPKGIKEKPDYLSRFLTEARSAGQLHHTNIVPVFEVGEADGLHYYSMQFIHGENLDHVIEDIKRLLASTEKIENSKKNNLSVEHSAQSSKLSESIAIEFINGPSPQDKLSRLESGYVSEKSALPRWQPSETDERPESTAVNDPESSGISSSVFGVHESPTTIKTRNVYHQRVAAVGVQVAEALDYAHCHGVLHRDVKPANLILDTEGTVWVTDFGLAKVQTDDLTHTGDIIGTLRYMAPERFNGTADRRSDVYSFGLTLYEMCTLRCAFDHDRGTMAKDVAHSVPLAPRKIDESIPADLETIILKAIESQPERRYQTAKELAEDLELFLADRPIKARRASIVEKSWRVCRRNPAATAMCACILALLVAIAIGSIQFAAYKARQTADEIKLRKTSQRSLFDSKLDQARSRRYSQRLGQRFVSLEAVKQAVELLPKLELSPDELAESKLALRNEAVAALTLTDMKTEWQRSLDDGWGYSQSIAFDATYRLCAQGHPDGRIRVFETIDREENDAMILRSPGSPTWVIKLSPNGKYLASFNNKPNALYRDVELFVWNLDRPDSPIFQAKGASSFDFSRDSQSLAFVGGEQVKVLSLNENAQTIKTLTPGFAPRVVKLSDDGQQVAVSQRAGQSIEIWNLNDHSKPVWSSQVGDEITSMDWKSAEQILAVGTWRGGMFYWHGDMDVDAKQVPLHQNTVKRIHIDPVREVIATGSLDSTIRLTGLYSGRQVLLVDNATYLLDTGFSSDGRLCFTGARTPMFGTWKVATPELRVYSNTEGIGLKVQFHPKNSAIVLRTTSERIEFWDVERQIVLEVLENQKSNYAQFSKDGSTLFTSSDDGLKRWPIEVNKSREGFATLTVGESVTIIEEATRMIQPCHSDELIIAGVGFKAIKVDVNSGEVLTSFGRHAGLDSLQVTADDRWLLTGNQLGKGVGVWDMETGELETMLFEEFSNATVAAHPTNPDAFATNTGQIGFWNTGDWSCFATGDASIFISAEARFSSDGSLLAVKDKSTSLVLMESATGQTRFSLETLNGSRLMDQCFSSDDTLMALSCFDSLQVFDIATVRSELRPLGLDW